MRVLLDESVPRQLRRFLRGEYQQNLRLADIPILVLAARTNRLADLQSLIPEMLASLSDLKPGDIVRIAPSDKTPG